MLLLPASVILFVLAVLSIFMLLTGNAGNSLVAAEFDILETNFFCLEVTLAAFELDLSKLFALNDKDVVDGCCEIIAAEQAAST